MRIIVVGTSCAGKSTLGRLLGEHLDVEWIDLDDLWWNPNWVETPVEEFRDRVRIVGRHKTWVVSGGHSNARPILWPNATHIIWLNYSFPVVFSRSVRRTFRRCWTKELICNGNVETFGKAFFTRDSILWWVITTFRLRRKDFREFFSRDEMAEVQVIELTKPYSSIEYVLELLKTKNGATPDEE